MPVPPGTRLGDGTDAAGKHERESGPDHGTAHGTADHSPPGEYTDMEVKIGTTRIVLQQGDLAQQRADALVNAANSSLEPGGGVCGALHAAAGPALAEACATHRATHGQCAVGDAVATVAGDLQAQHVIHAVGPVWHDGQRGENILLERVWQRTLARAREIEARTIAFPAISTGVYGFPAEPAALIALNAIVRDIQTHAGSFDEVRIVLFDEDSLRVWTTALEEVQRTMTG